MVIIIFFLFLKKRRKDKDLDFTSNVNNNKLDQPGTDHQSQITGQGQIDNQVYGQSYNKSTGPQNSISNVSIYPESKSQK